MDSKTSRRTQDKAKGLKALHTLSADATTARLTLAQLSVPDQTNEITAIPDLLDHLAETKQREGALVTLDALGCQVEIADTIVAHKSDVLLALKGNQSTLEAKVEGDFRTAPQDDLVSKSTVEKGHGRIETRIYTASQVVDWIRSDKSYPGQPRFHHVRTTVKVVNRTEFQDRCTQDVRLYLSSAPPESERLAQGVRGHWGVESMHGLLDVAVKDDRSRDRSGFGAQNRAVVRRFALGLVRAHKTKGSVKTRRQSARWDETVRLRRLQIEGALTWNPSRAGSGCLCRGRVPSKRCCAVWRSGCRSCCCEAWGRVCPPVARPRHHQPRRKGLFSIAPCRVRHDSHRSKTNLLKNISDCS